MLQSKVWDIVNSVELVPVILLQKSFCITKTFDIWQLVAKLGSSSISALLPTVLYALGQPDLAKQLAISLVFYALFSSIGKFCFKRRRPGTYHIVYSRPTKSMAAFPSRHSVCMTVLASYTPFKYPLILLMVFDRIMLGKHYMTDCFVGYLIGELAVHCSKQVDNLFIIMICLIGALCIWKNGIKILAGTIPVLLAPSIICSPVLIPLVGIKFVLSRLVSPYVHKKIFKQRLVAELSTSILTLGAIYVANIFLSEMLGGVDLLKLLGQSSVSSNITDFLGNHTYGAYESLDASNFISIF